MKGSAEMTLKEVLDQGLSAVLAVAVIALWLRLNYITDRFFTRLETMDDERKIMQDEIGLSDTHLGLKLKRLRAERMRKAVGGEHE